MEYKQAKTEYPESFRREIALKIIDGATTVYQVRKEYSITGKMTVYNWVRWYKQYGVCSLSLASRKPITLTSEKPKPDKQSEHSSASPDGQRIKQLEQQLEDERLLKEMYARMIAIAEQEHKISIRKKTNTR